MLKDEIIKALTSYAEAKVKEDRERIIYEESDRHLPCRHHIESLQKELVETQDRIPKARNAGHAEGRIEAIEECANIAKIHTKYDSTRDGTYFDGKEIAKAIRQLKAGVK